MSRASHPVSLQVPIEPIFPIIIGALFCCLLSEDDAIVTEGDAAHHSPRLYNMVEVIKHKYKS
jgi:hypothetical protein